MPAPRTAGRPLKACSSLEAARSINQRLFETSLDLVVIVDRWGNILRVSPSAEAILGYRPAELVGESAVKLLYPEDLENTRNEMRLARRARGRRNFDCRYVHKDGKIVTLAWIGVWSEPEQQHFFIGRDMTERIKLEQQLSQAQRMEAIGQLTGGVAHDFNNILTVIIGMNEVLASAVARQPQLAECAKSIDEAAERGVQLTQRMLAFARKQPLEARVLDLNEIVPRMAADAAADARRAHPHRDGSRRRTFGGPRPIRPGWRMPSSTSRSMRATPCRRAGGCCSRPPMSTWTSSMRTTTRR